MNPTQLFFFLMKEEVVRTAHILGQSLSFSSKEEKEVIEELAEAVVLSKLESLGVIV